MSAGLEKIESQYQKNVIDCVIVRTRQSVFMSYVVPSSGLEQREDTEDRGVWRFALNHVNTTIDPYDSFVLTLLLNVLGIQPQKARSSCLYKIWCYYWDIPHILLSLQGIILYYYNLCDVLYLLFAPNVVVTRRRYKKWLRKARCCTRRKTSHYPKSK